METFLFLYEKCRLCLEQTGGISIFGSESTDIAENIYLCTGLRIQPKDGLPQKICNKCLEVIQNAKQLRDQASRNDTHLRSLFIVDGVDATETVTQYSEQDTNETTNNEDKNENIMGPSRKILVRKDLFEFEPSSTETCLTKNPVHKKTQEELLDDVHCCKKIRLDDDTVLYECPMSVSRHKQARDVINACLKNCNIRQDNNSPYNTKTTDPEDSFIKISAVDEELIFAPQSISNDTFKLKDPLGSDTLIDGTFNEQVIYNEESIYLVIEQNVPEQETIILVSTDNTNKNLEDIGLLEKEERNVPNTEVNDVTKEISIVQEEITADNTSKNVEDIDFDPLVFQTLLDERSDNIEKSPKKGRKRKFSDQNREIRKRKANTNQDYISANGKKVKCKTFKGNDFHCHCPKKCTEKLSADERKVEFDKFWKAGSYEARCALLQGYVKEMNKKRSYSVNSTRRTFSRKYYLQNIEICKKTFINTLCISPSRIGNALTKSRNNESNRDKRGDNNRISSAQLAEIYDFINSSPKYTSDCGRNSNSSTCLVPKNLPILYNKYKDNSNSPVSFSKFRQCFTKHFNVPEQETITVVSTDNTNKNSEDIGLLEKDERNIPNTEVNDVTKEKSIEQEEIIAVNTSKHVEDIDFDPLDLQSSLDKEADNIDKSPKKGRKRKFSDQNREIRKRKANTNQDYISANGKKVKCKTFKGNDFHCHCPKKCTEKLSADERKVEFDKFWKAGSYEARCALLQGYVKEMNKKSSYSVNSTRRTFSRKYYLQSIKICKKTFLNTLCISPSRIDNALTKSRNNESFRDNRGGNNRITSAQLAEIYDFINSSPKYTSDCGRNSNSSTCLVPKSLHFLYKKYKNNSNSPVSFSKFRQCFTKDFNVPEQETITVVSTDNTNKNLEDIGLLEKEERNISNTEVNDVIEEISIVQEEITAVNTSKYVEDVDFDPLDFQTPLDERSDNIDKSPKKGRKRKFSDQNREIRKRKANTNQDYISANGKKVKCKTFKGNDFHCHCPKKCTEKLSADERKVEFDKFWKAGSYEARCALLQGYVKEMNKKRSYSVNSTRRKFSRKYYLQNIEICKKTFLNTLRISPSRIDNALTKSRNNESIRDKRGGNNRITSAQLAEIYDFIDSSPKYTSRCGRNSNSSTCLVPKKLHILYNKYKDNSNSPVSFSKFRQCFTKHFNVPEQETITVVSTDNTNKNLENIGLLEEEERNISNTEVNDVIEEISIVQEEITAVNTSKHVEDIDFDPLDFQTPLDERSCNIDKSPKKGRKRKFSDQNREIRKRKANTNQDYISANGKKVKCKTFNGNDFHCHCPKKCTEKLSANERKVEFDKFWKAGSYEARCALLQGYVKEMNKKRSYSVNSTRRTFSRKYYLQNIEICKKTFLNTLCISPSRINNALTKSRNNESIRDKRGVHSGGNKRITSASTVVK